MKKIVAWLNSKGEKISELDLIVFDYRVIFLMIFSLVVFSMLVFFKINYSSINIVENILGKTSNNNEVIFGNAKGIRSDEWGVITPFMLSQAAQKPSFPISNKALGYGKTPLLMSMPVWHFTSFFRPQNWGFLLLDFDRGFSFYWNFKVFGLFLSFFFLLLLLTKNNFWISFAGSLWLLFSSLIQWWFSTGAMLPETIMCFSVITASIIYVLYAKKKVLIYLNLLFVIAFGINFILFFYLPYQIPLVYLMACILTGYVIKNSNFVDMKQILKKRIPLLVMAILVIVAVLIIFYFDVQDTINTVRNTVYPGKRIVTGGGIEFTQLFSGYYDMFLNEKKFPVKYGNICEASNFIIFFPFLILIFTYKYFKKKENDPIQFLLSLYLVIVTLWVILSFPLWIEKYSLLEMVPNNRMLVGIGVGNIILTIVFLANSSESKRIAKNSFFEIFMLVFAIFIAFFIFGLKLNSDISNLFTNGEIIFVSAVFSLIVYFLLMQKSLFFFVLLLVILILPGFPINPINQGLNSIKNRPLVRAVEKINLNDYGSSWIVFGSHWQASILQSSGANIVNGVKFAPELSKMKILDPENKFSYIYNRYAHIEFEPIEDLNSINFTLMSPDSFVVEVNPCNNQFRKMGIDYLILPHNINGRFFDCIEKIGEQTIEKMDIYRYKK